MDIKRYVTAECLERREQHLLYPGDKILAGDV
jgi:hypothetical protein